MSTASAPPFEWRSSYHEAVIVDPSDLAFWDEAADSFPGCTFFHSSAWSDVLSESYRYRPCYIMIPGTTTTTPTALLPLMEVDSSLTGARGVSLPFTDYCDPLARDTGSMDDLFSAALALGEKRRWNYIELRSSATIFSEMPQSEWHYGHVIDLDRADFSTFSAATGRNIRKAEKQSLSVTVGSSQNDLEDFCRLNRLTRKVHGLPPQPRRFFQAIYRHILSRDRGFAVIARQHDTPVAAALFFTFRDRVLYKYGASDRSFQNLRANNLIMWKAIQLSRDRGYRTLCLGRTEPGNEGLRKYKRGWGGQERLISYYRYDLRKKHFVQSPQAVRPWQRQLAGKLPLPFLNLVGNVLYRHAG